MPTDRATRGWGDGSERFVVTWEVNLGIGARFGADAIAGFER